MAIANMKTSLKDLVHRDSKPDTLVEKPNLNTVELKPSPDSILTKAPPSAATTTEDVSAPAPNRFVRYARKVYHPLGFKKGYNFLLFFIFNGALLGFTLARFAYIDYSHKFCSASAAPGSGASPGECYWFNRIPHAKVGIILHLATILPASLLAVFQFVPIIRYKALLYHRIAGYVILALIPPSYVGALMITAFSFGGDNATRSLLGTLCILTAVCLVLAYVNIKRLRIDQHRAWMLRAWAVFASIITLRIILILCAVISSKFAGATRHVAMPCTQILQIFKNNAAAVYHRYPACNDSRVLASSGGGFAVVPALFVAGDSDGATAAAAFDVGFGMAGWIALMLHGIVVEVYLQCTPRESERLRLVSAERRMERGFKA